MTNTIVTDSRPPVEPAATPAVKPAGWRPTLSRPRACSLAPIARRAEPVGVFDLLYAMTWNADRYAGDTTDEMTIECRSIPVWIYSAIASGASIANKDYSKWWERMTLAGVYKAWDKDGRRDADLHSAYGACLVYGLKRLSEVAEPLDRAKQELTEIADSRSGKHSKLFKADLKFARGRVQTLSWEPLPDEDGKRRWTLYVKPQIRSIVSRLSTVLSDGKGSGFSMGDVVAVAISCAMAEQEHFLDEAAELGRECWQSFCRRVEMVTREAEGYVKYLQEKRDQEEDANAAN